MAAVYGHPFLGVGLGYVGVNFDINTIQFYWFHSTLFQVVASMGIIGAAAYAVYYVARFRIVCRRLSNPFSLFTLVAWLGFEGYSLMDTGTFVPFPTMALVLVTAGVLEIANSRPQFKGEPDEYNRTFARGGAKAAARRYAAFTAEYTRKSAPPRHNPEARPGRVREGAKDGISFADCTPEDAYKKTLRTLRSDKMTKTPLVRRFLCV